MEYFTCISLKEAKQLLMNALAGRIVASEPVSLDEAFERIAAEDIVSKEDLPPFSRSTVDGFAVRSADTFGASEGVPALFDIVSEVAMGQETCVQLQPGQAVTIPTGGMLPAGADAVVMLEHAERPDNNSLLVLKAAAPGENVVLKGEDISKGHCILRQGQQILPQDIGALAACGFEKVPVRRKPNVAIISTGDELVNVACTPVNGQVRDINSYALAAMLAEAGCLVRRYGIVQDQYEELRTAVSQAILQSDLVVISGGSSVGARDHTVKVIQELGNQDVLFHGMAVKPGKPTIFGMIGKVPVFGLPGHPVAAMTVCGQIVKPAVQALLGQKSGNVYTIPARLTRNMASVPGRDDFIRVRLVKKANEYRAEPILGKSGLISTMAMADGIVHIPADKGGLYSEEIVQVNLITKP
ncbi:gephyrin-like molybdotransferase Glp [Sporomusa acidovorans]|uniref:Molybdopterin molybdenumtransferase n=1 Tax=Sporomusa acidovorans (strain ATCC 49682 / DSM 3132 / Mol) TaxID=1123286 RepID=A0ABZ3IXS6_SPOA4|nr:gephyrin-like molybdotransferase Glp [Sporomusa acidovorans]OZC23341.1 molybdopterin molybdenumtransferase [Sporomusa acidovorans DSM 3132]SDE42375.1 molybdopterin molybdochelatase [Sporomusa acidovorans]